MLESDPINHVGKQLPFLGKDDGYSLFDCIGADIGVHVYWPRLTNSMGPILRLTFDRGIPPPVVVENIGRCGKV